MVNQRLQPRPSDPQMQSQAKMMTFMMIMFGVIFYKFASGFMLYIMTSSAIGIIESKYIKWQLKKEEEEEEGDAGNGAAPGGGPSPGAPPVSTAYPAKSRPTETANQRGGGNKRKKRRR